MELNESRHDLKQLSEDCSESKCEPIGAEEFLACVLQNTNDLVLSTDVDGGIVSFSKSVLEVLGYEEEELQGRKLKELTDDPEQSERLTREVSGEGIFYLQDFLFRHADGHSVYCDIVLVDIRNPKGMVTGRILIGRNNTEWRQFQEELVRVDRLAEVGRNASGIVHELNNPLAVINEISGWMEVVVSGAEGLNDDDRTELSTSLSKLTEQANRCRNIVKQLLGFVRDAGPSRDTFDLHGLLKNSVSFLFPELKSRDVEVHFDLMEGPLQINSEPRMLEQVFVNLLSNAIHAIEEKGEGAGQIRISTALDGAWAVISFADNGTGIAPKDQKRIYEIFYTTKPSGKGTGLGLAISRKIIRQLGGDIHLESSFWEGATFIVRIPAGE